jgi:hypothetical protein
VRGSTSGFDEDIDDMTMSERRDPLETTLGVSYTDRESPTGDTKSGASTEIPRNLLRIDGRGLF